MHISLTIIMQVVLAYLLGFVLPYMLSIGNGAELFAIPIGMSLGIFIPGYFLYHKEGYMPLIWSIVGSGIAMALIAYVLPPLGLIALLFPVAGAFIGYYVTARKK